jgi:hypothetical protein
MLDYARQHAIEALNRPQIVVLATSGPAGVQAGEFPCEAQGLVIYLLLPRTSDHLFNLEHDSSATLLAEGWELTGEAQIVPASAPGLELSLTQEPGAQWCVLLRVEPVRIQIRRAGGWGNSETIDLSPHQ